MANKERRSIVDAQWQRLQPGWGPKEHDGERRMLYDNLEEGESIERLWSGGWKVFMEGHEVDSHDRGIIVATERRVLLMNRGRLSKNVSEISYSLMSPVKELDPGKVRISEPDYSYDLAVELWASDLAAFLQERILSGAASVESELSHVLAPGEQVRHWARCESGHEVVIHRQTNIGHGRKLDHWETSCFYSQTLAVATESRILLIHTQEDKAIASCPHGTIVAVEHRERTEGQEVRFVNRTGQVYAARFRREADPSPFVKIMREHAAAGRRASLQPRISAEWQLLHPIWHYRDDHENERDKLEEILSEDEHLEALLWGRYSSEQAGIIGQFGVIAATNRRLLFVSNSWLDKHVSQLPLDGVVGASRKGGELHIDTTPEYSGYLINGLDDKSRHDSGKKGQVEEFARGLNTLVVATGKQLKGPALSLAPAPPSEAKMLRIDRLWLERSQGWKPGTRKNERAKLYEILSDDEDIERLIEGNYKADVEGAQTHDVVVAATDRRIVFVYNGFADEHLNEIPYHDIEKMEVQKKEGFLSAGWLITLTGRVGVGNYVVHYDRQLEMDQLFIDCVQSHLGGSPAPGESQ